MTGEWTNQLWFQVTKWQDATTHTAYRFASHFPHRGNTSVIASTSDSDMLDSALHPYAWQNGLSRCLSIPRQMRSIAPTVCRHVNNRNNKGERGVRGNDRSL